MFKTYLTIIIYGVVIANSLPTFANPTDCAISPKIAYQQLIQQSQTHKNITTQPNKYSQKNIININTAEVSQLIQLPSIGAKKAQEIVEYRQTHGDYKDIYDLTHIKGIGKKTVDNFAHLISIQ